MFCDPYNYMETRLNTIYSHCVYIPNASNKLQLKEKQAMRVCPTLGVSSSKQEQEESVENQ